jgi:phosphopantetheinyl transferase
MPVTEVLPVKGGLIKVWTIEETAEELELLCRNLVHKDAKSFTLEARYRQYLVTLLLHEDLFAGRELIYLSTGKPVVKDGLHISITHSGNKVAMMRADCACGLDLEGVNERVRKVTKKFLTDGELAEHADGPLDALIRLWTAKEAMFKVHGSDTVFMRSNIFVTNLSPECADALLTDGALEFRRKIRFHITGEMMLAWTEPLDEN